MASEGIEQSKLAAIMFTDMVGYSALVQRDETLALELLVEHRCLLRSIFPKYHVTEIKTLGDGFLLEAAGALEAVQCAIEIQETIARRNRLSPPSHRFQIRIGIHLGRLVRREGDVFGDDVNIAARIEPLAEPGGICLSQQVVELVKSRVGLPILRLGTGELKNIQNEIQIHRLILPGQPPPFPLVARIIFHWRQRRTLRAALLWLIVLGLGGLLVWQQASSRRNNIAALDPKRIAVLPFANISRDPANDYLCDGVHEQLITTLSQVSDLEVIARTSVIGYKANVKPVREIGRDLRAGTVLEGSVRREADRLRITAQLIDARTEAHLWSQDFDFELKDIFSIQSDVARRITTALKVRLSAGELQQLAKRPTSDPDAIQLYFQARLHLAKRTVEDLRQASQRFKEAVGRDDQFALGWVGLADSLALLAVYNELPPGEAFPKVKEALQRALQIDPALPEAHASRAFHLHRYDWQWAEAEAEYRLGGALKRSGDATVHHWYALYLAEVGRFPEALEQIARAQAIAPFSAALNSVEAWIHYLRGDYDQAIARLLETTRMEPDYYYAHNLLGLAYLQRGNFDQAMLAFERAIQAARGGQDNALLAYALALKPGGQNAARQALSVLLQASGSKRPQPCQIALIYAALGEDAQVFQWLEQASRARSIELALLKVDPRWQRLRDQPEFTALVQRVGIP